MSWSPLQELVDSVEQERLIINRMDVDRVVHTPNGAHFTFSGSYGRDEAFQRFYVESAGDEQTWTAFKTRFLDVDGATYQAEVTSGAPSRRKASEHHNRHHPR